MKVRRIKAIKSLPYFFTEGDIHIEYGDNPGVFYQEKFGPNESGIGLPNNFISNYGFENYFFELSPVDFSSTDRYNQVKDNLLLELDAIEVETKMLVDRKKFIDELLS